MKAAIKKLDFVYLDSPQAIFYNDPFNVTVSSAIPNYYLNLSISCPSVSYYNNDTLVSSNGVTEVTLGTNAPPGTNCTLQTIATDAFTASNVAEIYIVPTTVSLTVLTPNITASQSNISYLLTSDAQSVPVDVNLYCNNALLATLSNVETSSSTQEFPVANNYWGDCYLNVTSTDPSYVLPADQPVSILSPLIFISPDPNTPYLTSDTISYNLNTINGQTPTITLYLTCENTAAGSGSNTPPSLAVDIGSLQWYGNCITTIGYIPYYNTTATLNVTVNRQLSVVEPLAGASIVSGTQFNYNSTAEFATDGDEITYTFSCLVSASSFNVTGPVNTQASAYFDAESYGICDLVASSQVAYYAPSSSFYVFGLLNTTIVTPSPTDGWVFYAGNSTIDISASPGLPSNGTATVNCSYNGQATATGLQIAFTYGQASGYNMTGYGSCNISTDTIGFYVDSSSTFSSTIPVTLEVGPISDVGNTVVTVSSPLTSQTYPLTLVGNCSIGGDYTWQVDSNGVFEVDMIAIPTGASCNFYTAADEAFQQSNTVTSNAKAELFLAFDVSTATAGQTIQVNVSTSDGSAAQVFVNITCTTNTQSLTLTTSTSFQDYSLNNNLSGSCSAVASPVSGSDYTNSNTVSLTILSPITVSVSPTDFAVGESVPVTVSTGDNSAPSVTVTVTCDLNGQMGTNSTANADQVIYVSPDNLLAYGSCTVTATNQTEGYNSTGAQVSIGLYRQLVISLPEDGASIVGGSYYTLNVTSIDNTVGTGATVYATCPASSDFTVDVTSVNQDQSQAMANVQGSCLLTANTSAPYYYNSSVATQIYVPTNVTILNPGPSSSWTYNTNNYGLLSAASGLAINSGNVEVVCSYNGTIQYSQNISVSDNYFNVTGDTGYGSCVATTYLDTTQYVNTQTTFNTQTSVSITSVGQSFTKRLYSWAKSFFRRK